MARYGTCNQEHGAFYYSGYDDSTNNHPRNGVAVIVTKRAQHVIGFNPVSDRIMLLEIQGTQRKINIIQIYAPTAEPRYNDLVKDFYNSFKK